MKRFLITVLSALFVFSLTGCGGGGGTGGDTTDNETPSPVVSSSVTYKLAIQGTVSANAIKGIQFEIVLPTGFTVAYDAGSGKTGAVEASQNISISQPIYSTFSPSSRILSVGLLAGAGIGPGEFATLTCDVIPGSDVPEVISVKAVDGSTATISGVDVLIEYSI